MGRSFFSRTIQAQDRNLELSVEAGQVVCPRGGIVDIERCFACGSYLGLGNGPVDRLVCAPPMSAELIHVPFSVVPR